MNRLTYKRLISAGFYLALIMLAAVSAYSYWHMSHLIHSNELAARSQKVQEELDHVFVNLLDIESGQRGCVLAGDLCFLEPSQHALDNIPLRLKVLRELTADQPQTQRLLDAVEPLIAQKVALLQKRILWLEKGDREAAIRSIRSGEGLKLMQNIRTVITAINAKEDRLLAVRQAAAQASNRNALLALLIGTCISLGLLLLIFSCLKREITRRRRTEEKLSRSEEEFRTVVNNMPTVIFKGYLDGSVDFFDDKVETLTGYPRGDFASRRRKWTDLILAEDKGIAKQVFIKALKNFGSYVREYRISTKEGEVIWIQERSQINFDQEGQADSVSGVFFDITAWKRGEEAVRESEENYRNLFDNAIEGVFQSTPEGRFLIVNPAFARLLGYASPQEMITEVTNIGQQLWVHPEMREEMKRLLLEHGSVCDYEILYRRRDGTPMWFSENIRVARGADGQEFYEGFVVDITERKQAEQTLQSERDRAQTYLDIAEVILIALNSQGEVDLINRKGCQILGYQETELIGKYWFDTCLIPQDRDRVTEVFHKLMAGEGEAVKYVENPVLTKGGEVRLIAWHNTILTDDGGRMVGLLSCGEDITERQRIEESLLNEKVISDTIINSLPGVFYCFDNQGRFLRWNRNFEQVSGYTGEEFAKLSPLDLFEGEARTLIDQAIREVFVKGENTAEADLRLHDGRKVPYFFTGRRIDLGGIPCMIGMGIDFSDRKQAEAEIKLNEARLASLVKIAHYESESIQDLLDFALNEAIALTGSKIGYIYFYDDETRQFTLNTWSKDVMQECTIAEPQTIYQLEKTGIWGEAVRQARPIMVNDFQAPHPLKKGYPEGHAELYKYLTIPVFSGERIVAVAAVANKATDYDQADVRQLTLMMDAVWKIVARRQAEEELRTLNLELEQRVQERTAQLEAANRELEAFSYSVSHDLRAPLRGIDGWSLAFLEDYGDGLDEQGRNYLDWVRAETQHMGQLIDDMLSLSRVDRAEISRKTVDLTALVQGITDKLRKTQAGTPGRVYHSVGFDRDGRPPITGDGAVQSVGKCLEVHRQAAGSPH